MNAAQAKGIPLNNVLAHLGFHPHEYRKSGNEAWYLSPFRAENEPSFKIKLSDNIWYDFGEGKGGNVIDFVMYYNRCSFRDALTFLENSSQSVSRTPDRKPVPLQKVIRDLFDREKPIITDVKPVTHFALKEYLRERKINPAIAANYLKEINYSVQGKEYFALGFCNRAGGWEIRSAVFKGSLEKKDISVIEAGSKEVSVYEGFMDFLSSLTHFGDEKNETDTVVLNSVALKSQAIEFIREKGYGKVFTYLDNDKAGVGALKSFQEGLPREVEVLPFNHLYSPYNDFNEYLINKPGSATAKLKLY